MDSEGVKPESRGSKLVPVPNAYGVPMLSTGQIAAPGQANAWRGPVAGKALEQLDNASRGDIETHVCDLPPGTRTVHHTMTQTDQPARAGNGTTPNHPPIPEPRR